jgi:hypothetical protein
MRPVYRRAWLCQPQKLMGISGLMKRSESWRWKGNISQTDCAATQISEAWGEWKKVALCEVCEYICLCLLILFHQWEEKMWCVDGSWRQLAARKLSGKAHAAAASYTLAESLPLCS